MLKEVHLTMKKTETCFNIVIKVPNKKPLVIAISIRLFRLMIPDLTTKIFLDVEIITLNQRGIPTFVHLAYRSLIDLLAANDTFIKLYL